MKISVIVPARNEESSIRALLDNLLAQTQPPDEIIVTDGGSTDRTAEIVESYGSRGLPVRVLRERAALPGRGRNVAARVARYEWLAFVDAGIDPEPDWLKLMAARAARTPEAEVVYGAWQPVTDTFFKECAALAYVPPPALEVEGVWMRPRSITSSLMRASVWQRVGGFPEHLRSAEDLLFMNEIERAGIPTAYEPRAVVRWHIQPTLWRTFRRFSSYARHNIRAGLWRDWQAAIFRRYALLIGAGLPAFYFGAWWLLVALALWALFLGARSVVALRRQRHAFPAGPGRNLLRVALLMPLLAVIDAAAIWGSLQWLVQDKLHLTGRESEGLRDGA